MALVGGMLMGTAALAAPPPKYFKECPDCPELVVIPAGEFMMGSAADEPGRFDVEGPRHKVSVPSFALARHAVTIAEYSTFLRETDYHPAPCDRILGLTWHSPRYGVVTPPGSADSPLQPAVCVNWDDARAYVSWLNGKVTHDGARGGGGPYRLPTEAEWEYAARAGTSTARWWGDPIGSGNANCNGCGSPWDNKLFAPVDSFGPNPFGLYDMLGNIWQWTEDCWNPNYVGAPRDGSAWLKGDCARRVVRGGSWSNLPALVRSAARIGGKTRGQDFDYASDTGFRVARSIR